MSRLPVSFFMYAALRLEPKEFGEFDDERTVLKEWSTSQLGIPDVVVDDE